MSLLNKFRLKEAKKGVRDEIFENICDLLNTKKGFGACCDWVGVDTFVYLDSNMNIDERIICGIKECLEKHEKRLQICSIRSIPSQTKFRLSFVIECIIENTQHSFQVSFHHQNKTFEREVSS